MINYVSETDIRSAFNAALRGDESSVCDCYGREVRFAPFADGSVSIDKPHIELAPNAQLEEWAYDPEVSNETRALILDEIQYRFNHNPYIGNFGGLVEVD